MLGSVAQSISMPRGGASPFVGQFFCNDYAVTSLVVPDGAPFVFLELVGAGSRTTGNPVGGGAGNDAIMPCAPGANITFQIGQSRTTPLNTTVTIGGTTLTALSGADEVNAGASGKYPGGAGGNLSTTGGGRGGGRLGGPGTNFNERGPAAGGGGARNGGTGVYLGGTGAICLTFFRTYDAALAFANSLYNDAWVVS